jgi:glycosyltransferase involved in cell wall biosynthesis
VTAVAELSACLEAAGVPCAIAAPAREAARGAGDARVVAAPRLPVPFGPLLLRPRARSLPEPVVVHVHGLASLVPWSPFLWSPRPRVVVATLHGVLDARARLGVSGPRALWHRRLDLPLLRRFAAVHATRDSEAESAAAAGARGTACIPWTLRDAPPSPSAPPAPGRYVLAVGRLHPIKGLDRLLAAFAALAASDPDVRLVLVGAGRPSHRAALRSLVRRLGLGRRVDFAGLRSREALRPLYAGALALAVASRYENFGMAALEALREGCPVLAARETPWAFLGESGAGAWVDFDDAAGAARAIADVERAGARARAAARAAYEERFAPARVLPRFLAWYAAAAGAA